MEPKQIVSDYLISLGDVIANMSSKAYSFYLIKNILLTVKGKYPFVKHITIGEEDIEVSQDVNTIDAKTVHEFFNDFVIHFQKKLKSKDMTRSVFHDVKEMVSEKYDNMDEIELDIEYFKSIK